MKTVQTKLTLVGLGAAILAAVLLRNVYVDYLALANFQQTTQVSIAASNVARALTLERQLGYQASAFLGEGTPEEMAARYRASVDTTRQAMDRLKQLASAAKDKFSLRFQRGLAEVIGSEGPLDQIRNEVLDLNRSHEKAAATALKDKTLSTYDAAERKQANFLPILAVETGDAELVRRIVTADAVARFQKDLWKIRGLVATALRDNRLTDFAAGELKSKRHSADDHVSRIVNLSDPTVSEAMRRLTENPDYVAIATAAARILELGTTATDFHGIASYADYQAGPFTRVERPFNELAATVTASIDSYTQARMQAAKQRFFLLVGFCLVTLFGLIAFIIYIARGVTRPLRSLSTQLTDTAERGIHSSRAIADSARRLSDDACQQAAAIEQISASVEELATATDGHLDHARSLKDLAGKAAQLTDEGKQSVTTLTTAMDGIQAASHDIATILQTIDEIAFQTNILALNAAVEAARAGEAGAGFAIVADEVRNLARRSAEAARETRQKIELALQSNTRGAEVGKVVQQRFADIAAITREYHSKVAAIESSSSQSNAGLSQVRDALARLDEITQRTAAAAEENAKASLEMSGDMETTFDRVESLQAMVTQFDKLRRNRAQHLEHHERSERPEHGAVLRPTRLNLEPRNGNGKHGRVAWPAARRNGSNGVNGHPETTGRR